MNDINRQVQQDVLRQMILNGQRQIGLMTRPGPKVSSAPRKSAIVEENRQPDRVMDANSTDPRGTGWSPLEKQNASTVALGDSTEIFADDVQRPYWSFRKVATSVLLFIVAVMTYACFQSSKHWPKPELVVPANVVMLGALIWLWRPSSAVYVGEVGPSSGNTFRLQRYDKTGSPLPPLPVEMRGRFKGNVRQQDRVEVYGKWSRRTFLARRIRNLTTGLMVVKASSMGIRFVSMLQLVAVLGFMVILAGFSKSATSRPFNPSPLIFVGMGIFFSSVLLGVIMTVLTKMISPDDPPADK
jgi:hypothetical protein